MRHEDHGGVEAREVALEPFERGDVEVVGGLVEEEQVGIAGEGAGKRRAGQLAAREAREGAVELVVLEAEPVQGHEGLGAPVPAAGVLEAGLGGRVLLQHGLLFGPLRHLGLEVPQAPLEGNEVGAAGQHVVTQAQLGLARGPLVVQRRSRPLLEGELAAIGADLSGEHPKQGGLAGPVAARQRHAVAPLELERDAPEQRRPRHVLVQRAGDHNGHVGQSSHTVAHRAPTLPHP